MCKHSEDRWSNAGETFAYFGLLWKNYKYGHIWPIIIERARPISTIYSALIDMWVVGMINLMFVLRSLNGRYYGNQLIWGTFCKHRNWPLLVFALEFRTGMHCRHLHKGVNSSDDAATLRKNLVNFNAVTPEITFLICVVIGRKSADDLHSLRWHFQTRWTIEISMSTFKAATVLLYLV